MTVEQIKALGLPVNADDLVTRLAVEAAFDWIASNTTIMLDPETPEDIAGNVKLFVLKFTESMTKSYGVASESLGGMSQTFRSGGDNEEFIWLLARQLLGMENLVAGVTSIPARRKWTGWV